MNKTNVTKFSAIAGALLATQACTSTQTATFYKMALEEVPDYGEEALQRARNSVIASGDNNYDNTLAVPYKRQATCSVETISYNSGEFNVISRERVANWNCPMTDYFNHPEKYNFHVEGYSCYASLKAKSPIVQETGEAEEIVIDQGNAAISLPAEACLHLIK